MLELLRNLRGDLPPKMVQEAGLLLWLNLHEQNEQMRGGVHLRLPPTPNPHTGEIPRPHNGTIEG
jgi:hypothetical protein